MVDDKAPSKKVDIGLGTTSSATIFGVSCCGQQFPFFKSVNRKCKLDTQFVQLSSF